MRGEFVDLSGARLYYYAAGTRGAGEPVLLIHGFPTSCHLWTDVVPELPPGHRVVVVDLLGFGRSDPPGDRDLSLAGHANRIVALLDELGIERACCVGHDIGGGIAQVLATTRPTRVSRLALVSSVAFDDWPTRNARIARALLPIVRQLPPAVVHRMAHTDLLRGYADPARGARSLDQYLRPFATPEGRDTFVAHLDALDATDTGAIADRLPALHIPVAVLWGESDPFVPVAIGRRLHETIPGATFQSIPGHCHFLPEEAPSAVASTIAQLLQR